MNSLQKSSWEECKSLIELSNPNFYKLLAEVSPSQNLPLYLATYQYGEIFGDKTRFYIPSERSHELIELGSSKTPNEVMKDLGYGAHSSPLGLITSKYCEWFSIEQESGAAFPFAIQGAGTIFNKQIVFQEDSGIQNSSLSLCSGSRTAFMLPSIGSRLDHERLREFFSIDTPPPKHPAEHFDVFKGILKNTKWHSKIIYFSQQWINEIKNNEKWIKIKLFLSEEMRKNTGKDLFSFFHNNLFMTARQANKFRPTPFLIDTAKIIFNIAANQGCGNSPAIDEEKVPLSELQSAYKNIYELKYNPTVMVPSTISQAKCNVFFSLQHPSTHVTSFKIKLNNSTIKELDALKDILQAYISDFTQEESPCYGSALYFACKDLTLNFLHNQPTVKGVISSNCLSEDNRFLFSYESPGDFARDARFFRGCVQIKRADGT